jgi:periplasmic protein TonB
MPAKSKKRHYLPAIVVSVVVLSIGGGAVALVRSFLGSPPSTPPPLIEQVRLIRPPPPPQEQPPPPPPEEKVEVPQPEQPPDPTPNNDPPPSTQLGLDAEGGSGSDAFGLVGNKGGRDLTATGGSAFAWYAGLLKDQILNELNGDDKLRAGKYSVTLRAWLRQDGSVARFEILKGSGDSTRDRRIAADLAHVQRLSQAPPSGMPDSISLQVVSRG